jgi:hypothetical protein
MMKIFANEESSPPPVSLNHQEMSSACNKKDRLKLPDIAEPHANDVLMGRGGKNNQHVGNEKLRVIARKRCNEYQIASKKGKSTISRELVKVVRDMVPPGRCVYGLLYLNKMKRNEISPGGISLYSGSYVRTRKRCGGKVSDFT